MNVLRLIEQIRTPFGDVLMGLITHLGEEMLFMAVSLIFFWCIDKKRGYFLLSAGFTGLVCVQMFKMMFRIPRPWVLDPKFTIVESAREMATGYSFPSGHTQCASNLYGGVARSSKKRWVQITGVVLCLLVAFSRMYLGVHTLLDVGVSLLISAVTLFVLFPVFDKGYERPRVMYITIGVMALLAIANLLFVMLFPFPADVDPVNLADAQKVAWQMAFLVAGMSLIYPIDRKFIKFDTHAVWWAQILKLVIGIGLVMLVRVLLKEPLNALFGINLGTGIRYFLIAVVAGILWPMTFKFWSRLGKKN
ncbi:MAG: phosphatase PAP2 family protein [Clostridia bacterium]|nr:phosphatase PAP2 family protein [Clostridia bacterium]